MRSTILARTATPAFCSCRNDSWAATHASSASANTPNLPRRPGDAAAGPFPLHPHSGFIAAGEFDDLGAGAPPRRPNTSLTMSRTNASLTAALINNSRYRLRLCAVDLFSQNVDGI